MPDLYLTPSSVSYLNQGILALVITIYFARPKFGKRLDDPAQTAYLRLLFAALATISALMFLDAALPPSEHLYAVYLENTVLAGSLLALLQFAYHFPSFDPRLRIESRIAFAASLTYVLLEAGIAIWRFHLLLARQQVVFRHEYLDYLPILSVLLIIMILGRAAIRNWKSPSIRRFAFIFIIPLWLAMVGLLRTFYYIPTWFYHVNISGGVLLTMFLFALNYIVSLPETTSFMAKISGVLLTSMLAILGIIAWIITPAYEATYDPNLPDRRTLVFAPNESGGYDVTESPFHFESDLGEKLDLIDDGIDYRPSVEVEFQFPFFGKTYDSVFLLEDGAVSMGEELDYKNLQYHFAPQAAIFALLTDLAPAPDKGEAVYLNEQADRLVITYQRIRSFYETQDVFTFQITLFVTGMFEISYNGLPAPLRYHADDTPMASVWAIGFKPEGVLPEAADFSTLPLTSGPNGLLQDEFLGFRSFLHKLLYPLSLAILGSSLLLLAGIPLILQATLTRPLNDLLAGVQAMNSGKRRTVVSALANDEIGYMTESFNRMSAELDGLILDLESRVAARTSELRDSEERYRLLFDLESDAIFIIRNSDGQILQSNDAAMELYGYDREELLACRNTDLSSEPEATKQATNSPAPVEQVVKIPLRWHRKKDGTIFPVSITARFITWKGEAVHLAAIRDITEQQRIEQELVKLAVTDALTSLPNRRHFFSQAENIFERSHHPPNALAVMMMDLDFFKNINDHYGHACGDEALRAVAQILAENVRPTDLLARLGGEEFAVLLPRTQLNEACNIGQRLCHIVGNTPIRISNGEVGITVSIGVAALDETVLSLDDLLSRADQALYDAKEAGRNCCRIWGQK